MPSTYTSRLRLEKQATGENDNTWGDLFDTLVDMIDAAIAGRAAVTHDDSASYTLTTANGTSDEARNMILNIGGTLTAARNAVVPTVSKFYVVKNATSGGYAVTVKTSGGTGISVPNGKTTVLFCDGTNVVDAIDYLSSLTVGGTLTVNGLLDLSAAGAGQIKFPATQNSSANANTFDDYEEGTFTVSDGSGASLSFSSTFGAYVKEGAAVHIEAGLTYPATADGSGTTIAGLPFTSRSSIAAILTGLSSLGTVIVGYIGSAVTTIQPKRASDSATFANSALSTGVFNFTGTYFV